MSKKSNQRITCKECGVTEKLSKFKGCGDANCQQVQYALDFRHQNRIVENTKKKPDTSNDTLYFAEPRKYFKNYPIKIISKNDL